MTLVSTIISHVITWLLARPVSTRFQEVLKHTAPIFGIILAVCKFIWPIARQVREVSVPDGVSPFISDKVQSRLQQAFDEIRRSVTGLRHREVGAKSRYTAQMYIALLPAPRNLASVSLKVRIKSTTGFKKVFLAPSTQRRRRLNSDMHMPCV